MKRVSTIGGLLKKIYRLYSNELLKRVSERGFTDLRPSFVEVLIYICENDGPSIKEIGVACGLKKQTMTSHLNELQKRGYINRVESARDRRSQHIHLTEYGQRFKLNLFESISELEKVYTDKMGEVELDRVEFSLSNFLEKVSSS
ncbi:MAG: winged helix-turn-helix transcriptional regulator [Bacteriovoracaceae bacterium]|nr:winged helix-turn-helix transcriptional regulator [Bacteriovoracaceae bacterium]